MSIKLHPNSMEWSFISGIDNLLWSFFDKVSDETNAQELDSLRSQIRSVLAVMDSAILSAVRGGRRRPWSFFAAKTASVRLEALHMSSTHAQGSDWTSVDSMSTLFWLLAEQRFPGHSSWRSSFRYDSLVIPTHEVQSTQQETQDPGQMKESGGKFRARVTAFYRKHNPSKLEQSGFVDKVVSTYKNGGQERLFRQLVSKYGPEPEEAPEADQGSGVSTAESKALLEIVRSLVDTTNATPKKAYTCGLPLEGLAAVTKRIALDAKQGVHPSSNERVELALEQITDVIQHAVLNVWLWQVPSKQIKFINLKRV